MEIHTTGQSIYLRERDHLGKTDMLEVSINMSVKEVYEDVSWIYLSHKVTSGGLCGEWWDMWTVV